MQGGGGGGGGGGKAPNTYPKAPHVHPTTEDTHPNTIQHKPSCGTTPLQDLRRVADAFAVGRWEARAPYLIPKGYVGVMGVTNRDNEPRGVRGLVLYEGADCVALCGFDNPYVGSHKSMARVQDRGCWTYFDGLTRIAAGVPDQAWEQLDAKGGQAQHTTRKGQQYTLTAQGHSDGDVRAPYGHLEFTLTQAQGPTRA